jgi:hypothetical protein
MLEMKLASVGVVLLLLSLMTSALSLFIQDCMGPGMIARRYYLWLIYHWMRNWRKKDRWRRWLLKPLGLCVYCQGAWIAIIAYLYYFGPKIEIVFLLGMNYLWLKILQKKIIS